MRTGKCCIQDPTKCDRIFKRRTRGSYNRKKNWGIFQIFLFGKNGGVYKHLFLFSCLTSFIWLPSSLCFFLFWFLFSRFRFALSFSLFDGLLLLLVFMKWLWKIRRASRQKTGVCKHHHFFPKNATKCDSFWKRRRRGSYSRSPIVSQVVLLAPTGKTPWYIFPIARDS